MKSLSKVFLEKFYESLKDLRPLPESIRGKTDDEIVAEMEDVLLHGPRHPGVEPLTRKALTDLFEIIEKAPMRVDTAYMTKEDLDDIVTWSKENR